MAKVTKYIIFIRYASVLQMPLYTQFPVKYIYYRGGTVIHSPQQMHWQHTQSQQLPSQSASTLCTGTNKITNTDVPASMEQMVNSLVNSGAKAPQFNPYPVKDGMLQQGTSAKEDQ